ncbi:MAG: HU family DNA-binding protein, partial [Planctomycetota bacterium]
EIIQHFLDEIINELSNGNRLEFRDFGVFEVKFRKARRAQNPRTLEKVHVPPKKVVKFKVGRVMREKVGSADADKPGGRALGGRAHGPETPPTKPDTSFGGTGTGPGKY